jgi:peptide/nickel transport system permease protein
MTDTPASTLAIEGAPARTALPSRFSWGRAVTADTGGRLAIAFLLLLVVAALAAPWLTTYGPAQILDPVALKSLPPSATHWFGTDPVSRDVFSRMLYGARVSLRIAVMASLLAASLGLAWGTVAAMSGPVVDTLMMRAIDAMLSIPRLLLILTVVALWPTISPESLAVVLGCTGWFGISRLARTEAVAVRGREFTAAARALGVSTPTLLVRHILPHAIGPVLVAATIAIGHVVVIEAGLFFLGVVPDVPASWGSIINDGRDAPVTWWWLSLIPCCFLVAVSLAVNAISGRLRSAINPRQLHGR